MSNLDKLLDQLNAAPVKPDDLVIDESKALEQPSKKRRTRAAPVEGTEMVFIAFTEEMWTSHIEAVARNISNPKYLEELAALNARY